MSIFNNFETITLTNDQQTALENISVFLNGDYSVFILKGYAGTGKTTILNGIVEYLSSLEKEVFLMAPTGRAAKVINQKTRKTATTIHKAIYCFDELHEIDTKNEDGGKSFLYFFKLRMNVDVTNSVFIIDEASMLSDILSEGEFFRFGSGHLLQDLICFARVQDPGMKTKIIFVGDPAQLPPIGMNFSPALDENYISEKFHLSIIKTELKEVRRQGGESGILQTALKLRKCLTSGFFTDFDLRENDHDIFNPTYQDFIPSYMASNGLKMIITYKNKTALDLNTEIRINKFGSDLPIQAGDHIIIGHNNYRAGIMNGEFGIVLSASSETTIRRIVFYTKGGSKAEIELKWRQIEILFPDEAENGKTVRGFMLENYLYGDNYLTSEEQQALYVDFVNRHKNLKAKTPEFSVALIEDQYFNAVQLKFGYAVTCHKAQGGEWDEVYVFWDRGVKDGFNFFTSPQVPDGKCNPDFYRWAYTAVTRSSKKLNCINPPYFTSFSTLSFVPVSIQEAFLDMTGTVLQSEEIVLDHETIQEMVTLGLSEEKLQFQDHFIELRHKIRKHFIDIVGWKKLGYEIRYSFKREDEHVVIKFWVNGKNEFKESYQIIPSGTTSEKLVNELNDLIKLHHRVIINRNNAELIASKVEFDFDIEESKPFLRRLYDKIVARCTCQNIDVEYLEHFPWVERYSFSRGNEKAIVDFQYNGDGFFTKALPVASKCNSEILITDLQLIVSYLQYP